MEVYFNTKELGEYLRIPEQTIRRWVMANEIAYIRIHNVIRFRMSEIEKWVDEHREKVPAFQDGKNEGELFGDTDGAEPTGAGSNPETLEETAVETTTEAGDEA